MSTRLYVFYLDDDEEPRRVPFAKWERISDKIEPMPAWTGQSVRIALAYIEVENRVPVFCPRIDGVICYFDEQGVIIDPEFPPIDLLSDLYTRPSRVVDLLPKIKKRYYIENNQWRVRQNIINKIVSAIWEK